MITLTTTVHDSEGGLRWLSEQYIDELRVLFDHVIVVATPGTKKEYVRRLSEQGVAVVVQKVNFVGKTYFESIKQGEKTGADYVFYCDFDRILHWIHAYPAELRQLVARLKRDVKKKDKIDYYICERTEEGYRKHHDALYYTEKLPNIIISRALGENKIHDHLSGCFIYSRKAAKIVVKRGSNKGQQHWGLWPVLLKQKHVRIAYKKCDGLEWETPDRYQEKIRELGSVEKFREHLSTPAEWVMRLGWAKEFVEYII